MILRLLATGSRRSQTTLSSSYPRMNAPLDLDFVLRLLDSSNLNTTNTTGVGVGGSLKNSQQFEEKGMAASAPASEINLSAWSKIKFKVIDSDADFNENAIAKNQTAVEPDTANNLNVSLLSPSPYPDFTSFFTSLKSTENDVMTVSGSTIDQSTSESTNISRLQHLADRLPLNSFDRTRYSPPASFFDIDQKIPTHLRQYSPETLEVEANTLPILQRDDINWKEMSLTKILKKIIPEEVFVCDDSVSGDQIDDAATICAQNQTHPENNKHSNTETTTKMKSMISAADFDLSAIEMRLLDRDQLHLLASLFKVSTGQTDLRIERDVMKRFDASKSKSKNSDATIDEVKSIKSMKKDPSTLSWTEENESLLLSTYEKLRSEKHNVDTKFQEFVTTSHSKNSSKTSNSTVNPSQSSLIRQRVKGGSAERGLWAVLSVVFSQRVGMRVSMSECRKKLIILKRLQQH